MLYVILQRNPRRNMAEKTLSQGLHTNSFLSALLNVLDPGMAASLAPQLDNQTIPHKFDVIVAGIRQRLKVADVMLNQLEISSHPTITQRVLFAAPSHLDGESSGTACHDDAQNQNTRVCVANLEERIARMEHNTAGNYYSDYDSNYRTEDDDTGG